MYIRNLYRPYGELGTTYQDLQSLVTQINQAVSGAPSGAQGAIQAVLNRNTGFSTPGFGTVQGLLSKLATFNPPSSFYGQDSQVLTQALADINTAIQQATPPPPPPSVPQQAAPQQAQAAPQQAAPQQATPQPTAPQQVTQVSSQPVSSQTASSPVPASTSATASSTPTLAPSSTAVSQPPPDNSMLIYGGVAILVILGIIFFLRR